MRTRAGQIRRGLRRWPHLGLEDPGELSFGEVDVPGECCHGEVVVEVVTQPGQQVAKRFGIGSLPGQEDGELRLSAGPREVDDQLARDGGDGLASVVVGDQRQGQIDAGGDAGGGPHVAVLDVNGVGIHGYLGDTRVCVYDRAGGGWSEPADTPQNAEQIATDLHTVLQAGNVPGPYVLAGHSSATSTPSRTPPLTPTTSPAWSWSTPPHPHRRRNRGAATTPDNGGSYDVLGRVSALVSSAARLGLGRLFAQLEAGSLPSQSRDEVRASIATAANLRSTIDEYVQANTSMEQAASLRDFAEAVSCPERAAEAMRPIWPRRTSWPPFRPTACTASSTAPSPNTWSPTKRARPPPAKRSSTPSQRSAPLHRCPSDPRRRDVSLHIHRCWSSTVAAADRAAPESPPARRRLRRAFDGLAQVFVDGAHGGRALADGLGHTF